MENLVADLCVLTIHIHWGYGFSITTEIAQRLEHRRRTRLDLGGGFRPLRMVLASRLVVGAEADGRDHPVDKNAR